MPYIVNNNIFPLLWRYWKENPKTKSVGMKRKWGRMRAGEGIGLPDAEKAATGAHLCASTSIHFRNRLLTKSNRKSSCG